MQNFPVKDVVWAGCSEGGWSVSNCEWTTLAKELGYGGVMESVSETPRSINALRSGRLTSTRQFVRRAILGTSFAFLFFEGISGLTGGLDAIVAFICIPVLVVLFSVYVVCLVLTQWMVGRDLRRLRRRLGLDVPMLLFIRSFDAAQSGIGTRMLSIFDPRRTNISPFYREMHPPYFPEEELGDAVGPTGLLVAIGDKRASYGAAKIVIDDEHWKQEFDDLSEFAQLIFLLPGTSKGLRWEVSRIADSKGLLAKTIFIMPRNWFSDEWNELVSFYQSSHKIEMPRYVRRGCYFRIDENGTASQLFELEQLSGKLGNHFQKPGSKNETLGSIWQKSC